MAIDCLLQAREKGMSMRRLAFATGIPEKDIETKILNSSFSPRELTLIRKAVNAWKHDTTTITS